MIYKNKINKMSIKFYPFREPTFKEKVNLPQNNTLYTVGKREIKKEEKREEYIEKIDIDLQKLTESKGYSLVELKEIAKQLKIPSYNSLKKKDLVKFIRLKLEKK